jgi:hypothetical protein
MRNHWLLEEFGKKTKAPNSMFRDYSIQPNWRQASGLVLLDGDDVAFRILEPGGGLSFDGRDA